MAKLLPLPYISFIFSLAAYCLANQACHVCRDSARMSFLDRWYDSLPSPHSWRVHLGSLFRSSDNEVPAVSVHHGAVEEGTTCEEHEVGHSICQLTTSGYYYWYYYGYGYYNEGPTSKCPPVSPVQDSAGVVSRPKTMLAVLSLWTVAIWFLGRILDRLDVRILRTLRNYVNMPFQLVFADVGRLVLVARFATSELIIVLSHYMWFHCAKRKGRQLALAIRPYTVNAIDDGEEVIMVTPQRRAATPSAPGSSGSSARRSLADIQLEIAGGSAHPAQRTRRQRYCAHRRRGMLIKYNPRVPGNCMFATLSRACLIVHGRTLSVRALRRLTKSLLLQADAGEVARCARHCGLSREDYIATVAKTRWGTNLDFSLLADALELPCSLINQHTRKILYPGFQQEGMDQPKCRWTVAFKDQHFTLCRTTTTKRRTCRTAPTDEYIAGGGPKRPYPLAEAQTHSFPDVGSNQAQTVPPPPVPPVQEQPEEVSSDEEVYDLTLQRAAARRLNPKQRKDILLVYHGTFGPFHVGHGEAVRSALAHIQAFGGRPRRAIVGFTTERQCGLKVTDCAFAKVADRASIALAVLAEGPQAVAPMTVDRAGYSSGSEMAAAHEHPNLDLIYLVGTDVMKNPTDQTI
eukprot:2681433-Amphidinium_carterae.1